MFHKARNIDKVRHWKKMSTTMKDTSMMKMGCTTVLRYVKKLKKNDNIGSFKIKSDGGFFKMW